MSDFNVAGNPTNPLFGGGGSSTTTLPVLVLLNALLTPLESPLRLFADEDGVTVGAKLTANTIQGAAIDWTQPAYAVSAVSCWLCSVNLPQVRGNAVLDVPIVTENITPSAANLLVEYAFSQAQIALLTGLLYRLYAEVTFSNGNVLRFGRSEVQTF